jgi:hypothetical protein
MLTRCRYHSSKDQQQKTVRWTMLPVR